MIAPIVAAALWAVLASLALSVVLGAGVAGVIAFFRPAAATRQALWSIALGAAGLAPVVILAVMLLRGAAAPMDGQMLGNAPLPDTRVVIRSQDINPPAGAVMSAAQPPAHAAALRLPDPPDMTPLVAQGIALVWALGALGGLVGLVRSLLRVRGLKLRSSPLDGELATDLPWLTTTKGREIYLRLSYETETPIAVGFRRPVILIPTEMATAAGLTSIEPLVMHEYAHLARYDDWTNLVQRAIERVFWFNPLVWMLGRRIALEREVAADEAVVARTNDAKNYASALWRMAQEMRMPEHVVVAPGAMLTRKQISVRIERLLEEAPLGGRKFGAAGLVVAALALTGVAAVAATAPAVSLASNDTMPVADITPAPHIAAATKPHTATPKAHVIPHQPVVHVVLIAKDDAPPAGVPVAPPSPVLPVAPTPDLERVRVLADMERVKEFADLQRLKDLGPRVSAEVQRDIADATSASQHDRNHAGSGPISREMVASCVGCDFSHRDLHGIDLSGISLVGDDFAHANLTGANLSNVSFQGLNFDHAVLTGANLDHARLTGIDFTRANLDGANLSHAVLTGVDLGGASMNGTHTDGVHLIGSSLP